MVPLEPCTSCERPGTSPLCWERCMGWVGPQDQWLWTETWGKGKALEAVRLQPLTQFTKHYILHFFNVIVRRTSRTTTAYCQQWQVFVFSWLFYYVLCTIQENEMEDVMFGKWWRGGSCSDQQAKKITFINLLLHVINDPYRALRLRGEHAWNSLFITHFYNTVFKDTVKVDPLTR